MTQFAGENAAAFRTEYGNISAASTGAIQRGLVALEEQGADAFFGEPALDLNDLIQTGPGGKGVINILAADKLMQSPKLYATFLLWMLAELYENLPATTRRPWTGSRPTKSRKQRPRRSRRRKHRRQNKRAGPNLSPTPQRSSAPWP
jgi:hypothetical protein